MIGQTVNRLVHMDVDDRGRLMRVSAVLAVPNVGTWLSALTAFHGQPALLGIALTIYGLGVCHAVDADRIGAIDNVTRTLMQENQRPTAVGIFFAMRHLVMVTLMTVVATSMTFVLGGKPGLEQFAGTSRTRQALPRKA